jgi:hypothetical protein
MMATALTGSSDHRLSASVAGKSLNTGQYRILLGRPHVLPSMRRLLVIGFALMLCAASSAVAAPGKGAREVVLNRAVGRTARIGSLRYVMDIAVIRRRYPATVLHVTGERGPGTLFVHVKALAELLADGTQIPGPQQSSMLDGPFLYEGAPNGIAINGTIRWLRVPVAHLGKASQALTAMHNLGPLPLLHVLDESRLARRHTRGGVVKGTVRYDDPIVRTALTGMTGGIEFRNLRFEAKVGADGFVHAIKMTGRTADGAKTLSVSARLYAFGRPVRLTPPAQGTFMDDTSSILAD